MVVDLPRHLAQGTQEPFLCNVKCQSLHNLAITESLGSCRNSITVSHSFDR